MRRLLSPAAYLVLLGGMICTAYWAMFSQFQQYDDEGYVDLTLRHFLDGSSLYDEINTQYGPFYYAAFGALFKLTGAAVSTNSGRLVQIALWVTAALLCGLAAHQRTRRLALGVAATAITFRALHPVVNEPMHPGALLSLLVATSAFVLAVIVPARHRTGLALLGAVAAATALVKINVGGFVIIALAFAATQALPGFPSRRLPRLLTASLFVGVAPLLLLPDLANSDTQNFAIVVAAGALALLLVVWPSAPDTEPRPSSTLWLWLIGGAVALSIIVVGVIVALGTGIGDLIQGTIIRPSGQRTIFHISANIPDAALLWAIASLGFAYAVRAGRIDLNSERGGALRVATGLGMWFMATSSGPLTIGTPSSLGLLPLLGWVAAVSPRGPNPDPIGRLARIGIPAIAILQALHAYPVAGSQIGFASVLYGLLGAICIGDGLAVLTPHWSTPRPLTLLVGALAGWAVLAFVVRDGTTARRSFHAQTPLPFFGASRVRLPADQVASYSAIVKALQSKGCKTVVGLPTLGSITMWAGADVPVGLEPDGWPVQLDAKQQQAVLDRMPNQPAVCGLNNSKQLAGWLQGGQLKPRPMVRYVRGLQPAEALGDYQLLVVPSD